MEKKTVLFSGWKICISLEAGLGWTVASSELDSNTAGLNDAYFKPVLLFCTCKHCVVAVSVGSGKYPVVLQRFVISGWERCPFVTMALSGFFSTPPFLTFCHILLFVGGFSTVFSAETAFCRSGTLCPA